MVDETGIATDGADFAARVMTYGQLDAMGFGWADGCLDASLDERLPVLTWAHDWADPIGRATSWRRDGADVILYWQFDDVPRATQARTQLRSGTITDISVGLTAMELEFDEGDEGDWSDVTVTSGTVAECALTLRGAVPGARVLPATITFSAETWRGLARRTPSAPVPAPLAAPVEDRVVEWICGRCGSAPVPVPLPVPAEDQVVEWAGGVERMQAALTRAGRPTTPRRTRR